MSAQQEQIQSVDQPSLSGSGGPGTKNWSSALSKVPAAFREAMLRYAQVIAAQPSRAQVGFDRDPLEVQMLGGGRALSFITYAGFLPLHLVKGEEQEAVRELLATKGPHVVFEQLRPRLEAAQTIMFIGDDPSADAIDKAMSAVSQEANVRCIVIGPGNLMEGAVREWAARQEPVWPASFVRTLDGTGGEVWQTPASDRLDRYVTQLFDVHKPDRVALLEPVRLPATQASIEQAAHRRIPMVSFAAQRIGMMP